jgi:preprotein translocase SecE subunit
MARQSRQQRRERRTQGAQPALAGAPPAPPPRRPTAADRQPRPEPHRDHHEPRVVPGSGFMRFIGECIGELKKVEWPGQKQVVTGTMVVIVACAIVGTYLWLNDLVWQRFVENVLLR